jgi:hypothetical protein
MLTRNCQKAVGLLLTEDDFNVRVTVAKNASLHQRYTQKSYVDGAWKEYMRDSMGEILNSGKICSVECFIAKDNDVKGYSYKVASSDIINHVWSLILNADGVRFKITNSNNKKLSWIIVRE